MSVRRLARLCAPLAFAAALALGGCALDPNADPICTDQGPNSPSWPLCAPADPGGHVPGDDPIDPTGRSPY